MLFTAQYCRICDHQERTQQSRQIRSPIFDGRRSLSFRSAPCAILGREFATYIFSSVPPVLVWLSGNNPNHWRRATAIGLQLAIANCGGFPATFIYSTGSPNYVHGHTVCMALLAGAWVAVAAKCFYLMWRNKQKAAGGLSHLKGSGDETDPDFKFII